jgi:hypothetical protein
MLKDAPNQLLQCADELCLQVFLELERFVI